MERGTLMGKITVIGLGAGTLDQLPFGIYKMLTSNERIFLRTKHHPVIDELIDELTDIRTFDEEYEKIDNFDDVYKVIVQQLIHEAKIQKRIIYAVPGHPLVAEKTVQLLLEKEKNGEIEVEIKGGQSFLDSMFTSLKIDPIEGFQLVDAQELNRHELQYRHHIIISQVYDQMMASEVKLTLMEDLPYDYNVYIVTAAGSSQEKIQEVPLYELDHNVTLDNLTSVYVPPVKDDQILYHQFSTLRSVIAELRGPNGCPWDKKQTHQSLKKYLIEECYELLEAIDSDDIDHFVEELGDVLLQIMLHAQIGEDNGLFSIDEVINELTSKMIRRHPHVFGDVDVKTSEEVVQNWEQIKKGEKGDKKDSLLDDVAKSLPALSKAYHYQKKAAKVGFDWPDVQDAWKKVFEEIKEFEKEIHASENEKVQLQKEFGDMLFALVNIGRFYGIEPEEALTMTNHKFYQRFSYIEEMARKMSKKLQDMTLEEMDQYWEKAKDFEGETL